MLSENWKILLGYKSDQRNIEHAFLLFKVGDYFKYFLQKRAIIGGRLLIEGQLLFEEIR